MRLFRLDGKDMLFWGISFGAALLAAAAVNASAFLLTPAGYTFSGFLYNSHDHYSYPVWSAAFARGGLLADNLYSTLPQPPGYFNFVWFVIGKLMRYTGLPFLVIYYAFGALAGGLMYLSILALMREFIADRAMAWSAYLLAGFSSGFGWIVVLISPGFFHETLLPGDIFYGEGYPFLLQLIAPHMVFSSFLVTLIYLLFYRGTVSHERKWLVAAGVAALVLTLSHPYHLVTLVPVLLAWYLALTLKYGKAWLKQWLNLPLLAVFTVPPLIYFLHLFRTNPNFAPWASQNIMRTFGWSGVILGFGPLIFLALLAYPGITPLRARSDKYLLVVMWAVVNFSLLFSYPLVKFEARLVLGLILPLSILGACGLFRVVLPLFFKRSFQAEVDQVILGTPPGDGPEKQVSMKIIGWVAVLVLLTMPTHGLLMFNQFRAIVGDKEFFFHNLVNDNMIVNDKEMEALRFMAKHARGQAGVMSSIETGVLLPAFADVRSFIGNLSVTPDWKTRRSLMEGFYSKLTSDEERLQILNQANIEYVWWGPNEVVLGKLDPASATYLSPVFDNGIVRIYRVIRDTRPKR